MYFEVQRLNLDMGWNRVITVFLLPLKTDYHPVTSPFKIAFFLCALVGDRWCIRLFWGETLVLECLFGFLEGLSSCFKWSWNFQMLRCKYCRYLNYLWKWCVWILINIELGDLRLHVSSSSFQWQTNVNQNLKPAVSMDAFFSVALAVWVWSDVSLCWIFLVVRIFRAAFSHVDPLVSNIGTQTYSSLSLPWGH